MITTMTGSNTFMLQQELDSKVSEFVGRFSDIGVEKLDGQEASAERLIEATKSLPFLVDQKLVVLRNPSAQKDFVEKINVVIESVPDGVEVIVVEPKIDRRSSYFKVLKSKTEFKEFGELDSQKLSTWIVQYISQQGGRISLSDARYLVERVGLNQQILHNELDKLLTYKPQIGRTEIDLLTEPTPQSSIFELIDSAFAGNHKRTLELYRQQRAMKVEPQQIMAMIAWQLHVLSVVKTAADKSVDDIARQAKLNPFVVRKTAAIAGRINLEDLKQLVNRALQLDIKMKSSNIDNDEALQHFLLTIS